ncbi:MAG: hypothetical protein IT545_03595 [Rhodobacteraceae bacterium]|nr:hypothetical protein [Paracoccaceae bacterium]
MAAAASAPPAAPAGPSSRPHPAPPRPAAAAALAVARDLHRLILERLGAAPLAEDALLRDLALPPAAVAHALLDLELDGAIARQPGGLLARLP